MTKDFSKRRHSTALDRGALNIIDRLQRLLTSDDDLKEIVKTFQKGGRAVHWTEELLAVTFPSQLPLSFLKIQHRVILYFKKACLMKGNFFVGLNATIVSNIVFKVRCIHCWDFK